MWVAGKDKMYGVYDLNGKLVVHHKYYFIDITDDSIHLHQKDGLKTRIFVADKEGNIARELKEDTEQRLWKPGNFCGFRMPEYVPISKTIRLGRDRMCKINKFNQYFRVEKSLNDVSLDSFGHDLYIANDIRYSTFEEYSNVHTIVSAISDTNLRFVYTENNYKIINYVYPYWQVVGNAGYALEDTNGAIVTRWFKTEIAASYRNSEDSLVVFTKSVYIYFGMDQFNRQEKDKDDVADSVFYAHGQRVETLHNYTAFRYITRSQMKQLGENNILFAKNKDKKTGIINLKGETIFPALSFKYKDMIFIDDANYHHEFPGFVYDPLLGIYSALNFRSPRKLNGNIMVIDSSGRVGYFTKTGTPVLPEINFRYKNRIKQIGNHLWDITVNGRGQSELHKIINDNNEDFLPGFTITGVYSIIGTKGLLMVASRKPNGDYFTFYMSENGVMYFGKTD